MKQKNIFFKSDFKLMLESESGWSVPFRLKFYTNAPSLPFIACYDGTEYMNCHLQEDGRLCIGFDAHGLGLGLLMMEPTFYLNDECYASGVCDEIIPAAPVVCQDEEGVNSTIQLTLQGSDTLDTVGTLPAFYMKGDKGNKGTGIASAVPFYKYADQMPSVPVVGKDMVSNFQDTSNYMEDGKPTQDENGVGTGAFEGFTFQVTTNGSFAYYGYISPGLHNMGSGARTMEIDTFTDDAIEITGNELNSGVEVLQGTLISAESNVMVVEPSGKKIILRVVRFSDNPQLAIYTVKRPVVNIYAALLANGWSRTIAESSDMNLWMLWVILFEDDNYEVTDIVYIPRGKDGLPGTEGPQGPQGPQGEKGEPGSVDFETLTPEQLALLQKPAKDAGVALLKMAQDGDFDGKDGAPGAPGEDGQPGTPGKDGKTPVKGVDYFTDADKQAMVQQTADTLQPTMTEMSEKIDELQLFKFPNVTIFGQPSIQQGQISNFSADNYLQFPFVVDFAGRPWQIDCAITTGSNVSQQHNVLDSAFGLAFAFSGGKFVLALSSDGTSWNLGATSGTHTILANTTYYIRISWNGSVYKLAYSTDNETWVDDITVTSSASLASKQIIIGKSLDNAHIFNGSINMNEAKLTISDKVVWVGMDDAGLATRMAVNMNNIDNEGIQRVKEIIKPELDTLSQKVDGLSSTTLPDVLVANTTYGTPAEPISITDATTLTAPVSHFEITAYIHLADGVTLGVVPTTTIGDIPTEAGDYVANVKDGVWVFGSINQ